jgi:cation diffusion facilitator family transporter
VGWIGLALSILVGGFTLFIGILNGSKALIAASLCCGIDIATALTVLLGLKLSGKPIDLEHPYGHGKVEFLVVGGISALLIISAFILFFHSAKSIFHGDPGPDQLLTLVAAMVAAAVNEIKYRYAKCVGQHFNSPAIESHAEHARVDAISFMAVALAVLCAMIGLHFVDPLIAIFEIGHLLRTSVKMLLNSVRSLMDVSLPDTKRHQIKRIVDSIEEVKGINYLIARQLGQHIWIELSVFIEPDITVYEGKNIAEKVKYNILNNLEHVGNVQIQFVGKAA